MSFEDIKVGDEVKVNTRHNGAIIYTVIETKRGVINGKSMIRIQDRHKMPMWLDEGAWKRYNFMLVPGAPQVQSIPRTNSMFIPIKYEDLRSGMIIAVANNRNMKDLWQVKTDANKHSNVLLMRLDDGYKTHYTHSMHLDLELYTGSVPNELIVNPGFTTSVDGWSPHTLKGAELDSFGHNYGVGRKSGQSDAEYRNDIFAAIGTFDAIRPKGTPIKKPCIHEWYCDYKSMFHSSMDKYSCKHCGAKKEEV